MKLTPKEIIKSYKRHYSLGSAGTIAFTIIIALLIFIVCVCQGKFSVSTDIIISLISLPIVFAITNIIIYNHTKSLIKRGKIKITKSIYEKLNITSSVEYDSDGKSSTSYQYYMVFKGRGGIRVTEKQSKLYTKGKTYYIIDKKDNTTITLTEADSCEYDPNCIRCIEYKDCIGL